MFFAYCKAFQVGVILHRQNRKQQMKGKQNIARLAVLALALSTGVQASAQWNADSTEYDSFDRYRIGGYGELVGAFKN